MTLCRIVLLVCALLPLTHAADQLLQLLHGLTSGSDSVLLGFNETFLAECHADIECYCIGHPPGECVPDCDDCTGYYLCLLDHYEHKYCPLGQIYYPATQTCAPGKCPRIDCITPPTQPPPLPTTTTPPPPPPTTTPPPPPTTTTTPPPPPECPVRIPSCDFDGEILPDPEHCTYFWTCVNGCAVLGFCNTGFWYDPVKRVCDYRQNVLTCIPNKD